MTRWIDVGALVDIPVRGSRVVTTDRGDIALFRTADDMVFAVDDKCPHLGGPLSQGIVHGHAVTCPLHNLVIDLESGQAKNEEEGCTRSIPVKIDDDRILLRLSVSAEKAA